MTSLIHKWIHKAKWQIFNTKDLERQSSQEIHKWLFTVEECTKENGMPKIEFNLILEDIRSIKLRNKRENEGFNYMYE